MGSLDTVSFIFIRTLLFLALFIYQIIATSGITVLSTSYGYNCNTALYNNFLTTAQNLCDGNNYCTFSPCRPDQCGGSFTGCLALGDPAGGCRKTIEITYKCNNDADIKTAVSSSEQCTQNIAECDGACFSYALNCPLPTSSATASTSASASGSVSSSASASSSSSSSGSAVATVSSISSVTAISSATATRSSVPTQTSTGSSLPTASSSITGSVSSTVTTASTIITIASSASKSGTPSKTGTPSKSGTSKASTALTSTRTPSISSTKSTLATILPPFENWIGITFFIPGNNSYILTQNLVFQCFMRTMMSSLTQIPVDGIRITQIRSEVRTLTKLVATNIVLVPINLQINNCSNVIPRRLTGQSIEPYSRSLGSITGNKNTTYLYADMQLNISQTTLMEYNSLSRDMIIQNLQDIVQTIWNNQTEREQRGTTLLTKICELENLSPCPNTSVLTMGILNNTAMNSITVGAVVMEETNGRMIGVVVGILVTLVLLFSIVVVWYKIRQEQICLIQKPKMVYKNNTISSYRHRSTQAHVRSILPPLEGKDSSFTVENYLYRINHGTKPISKEKIENDNDAWDDEEENEGVNEIQEKKNMVSVQEGIVPITSVSIPYTWKLMIIDIGLLLCVVIGITVGLLVS